MAERFRHTEEAAVFDSRTHLKREVAMARVVISYVFADGDQVQISVEGKHTYPDALAELRKTAALAFTEAFAQARVTASET